MTDEGGATGTPWWFRRRRLPDVLALLGLLAAAVAGHWRCLSSAVLLVDEHYYFAAFERVAAGRSPYGGQDYLYLPLLALVGGMFLTRWGASPLLLTMRGLNLAGACLASWVSTIPTRMSWRTRMACALALVLFAPPLVSGLELGNLSALSAGLALLGWVSWRSLPLFSGAALALSLLVKPLAAAGMLVLALHRPRQGAPRQLVSGLVAALIVGATLLPAPDLLREMLYEPHGHLSATSSVSLHRVLACFGLTLPVGLVVALATIPIVACARRRPLAPEQVLLFSGLASALSLPRLWNHSLVIVLPAICTSTLHVAKRLLRDRAGACQSRSPADWARALWVAAAVLALFSSSYWTEQLWSPTVQGLLSLLPIGALIFLSLLGARVLGWSAADG